MQTRLSHYFLTVLAIAYTFGIVLEAYLQPSLGVLTLFTLLCTTALVVSYLGRYYIPAIILSILLFLQAGLIQQNLSSSLPSDDTHIYNIVKNKRELVAIGRLQAMPSFNGSTSQATIKISAVRLDASSSLIPAKGLILLRMHRQWPTKYEPGTLLAIHGVFQRPSSYQTPGIFDYPQYLAQKNIWITGFVRSPAQLHSISENASLFRTIIYYPEKIRDRFGSFLDRTLQPQNSSLYRALLIGDRSRIDSDVLEQFKSAGTMHILAISGLHITLLLTLLYSGLYWLLRRSEYLVLHVDVRKIAGACCIPFITIYALLAGMNDPVIRACTISGIILIAFISNRPKTLTNLIAFAALLILVPGPQSLFTASFQLSFAAFISIMASVPLLKRLLTGKNCASDSLMPGTCIKLFNWIAAGLIVSSAAMLGTAPILISHFHRFPLVGPFANLLIEPLLCLWALPMGLIAIPCSFLMPELAKILLQAGGLSFDLALRFTEMVQRIPNTSLWLPSPSASLTGMYYLFLAVAVLTAFGKFSSSWSKTQRIATILPFLVTLALLLVPSLRPARQIKSLPVVHIIDVGHGSASLIELPTGENILVDGGGSTYSQPTVGERIIAPFLWNRNITRIDTIIISHPDTDHYNGIPFIMEHFSPSRLWISHSGKKEKQFRTLIERANQLSINVIEASSTSYLRYGDVIIQCLTDTSEQRDMSPNDNDGLIIQMTTPIARYLFPGDISEQTELLLIERGIDCRSDVLVAAHHGSATSNSEVFLHQVAPKLILSSSGATQKHLFPAKRLKEYCRRNGIPLVVTATNGTISVDEHEDNLLVHSWHINGSNPLRRTHISGSAQSGNPGTPLCKVANIRLR